MLYMEIVETSIYTEDIVKILTDEEYCKLQEYLVQNPESGDLIKGSMGLKKLRWKYKNSGKSGNIRNIYYYYKNKKTIYMIYVYEKNKVEDLTPKQIKALSDIFIGDKMDNFNFNRLLESVQETNDIIGGKKEPSRKFYM